MSSFKKTPVQTLTNASVVTSEEVEYWQQLGVSSDLCEFGPSKCMSISLILETSHRERVRCN